MLPTASIKAPALASDARDFKIAAMFRAADPGTGAVAGSDSSIRIGSFAICLFLDFFQFDATLKALDRGVVNGPLNFRFADRLQRLF